MTTLTAIGSTCAEVRLQDRQQDALLSQDSAESEVARLAAAAKAGDRAAFGRLFEQHAGVVRGLLLARVPARDVLDLCQEAFAAALASIHTLAEPARFGPWLATITRNLASDAGRRSRGRERSLEDDLPEPTSGAVSPQDAAASAEMLEIVRDLPEAYCETLILRLVEGLSGAEIAARTGLTHGSVRVNLHRGMRLLRERLGETSA